MRGCSLPIVSPLSRFGIVTWLAKRLEPLSGLAATQENTVCVARLLGGAAALLGEPERARGYYEQALEVAARAGNRPEAALTHLQMAELLLDEANSRQPSAISTPPGAPGGEAGKLTADKLKAEGSEHLDLAIAEFRAMKMQPSLERALRHKEVLKA